MLSRRHGQGPGPGPGLGSTIQTQNRMRNDRHLAKSFVGLGFGFGFSTLSSRSDYPKRGSSSSEKELCHLKATYHSPELLIVS